MNDSLPQLPDYNPRPNLWNQIEADLDADEKLGRLVQILPTYEPKADLWNAIDRGLASSDTIKVRLLWHEPTIRRIWVSLAVACVVILVGVWLFLRPHSREKVQMEYAVEQTDLQQHSAQSAPEQPSSADKRAEEFIARQCAEQRLACQRPEVHELRNQLINLMADQQRITRERQLFGDDPALVRAQVKVENQRALVTKELITLLRS